MGNVVDSIVENASKGTLKKLEGIRAVKGSSSSAQPVQAKPGPEPESADPDSPKSTDTVLPDTAKMADFKNVVVKSFGIVEEDISKVSFSGAATKYDILKMIAKEMYQKGRQAEYINAVTSVSEIDGKIKFKKTSELNQIYQSLVPDPEVK